MNSLAVELVVEAVQELIVDPGKRLGQKKNCRCTDLSGFSSKMRGFG
jgi:hypothetical protein